MQAYNHVAGGLVFTGIFSSLHDVNVLSSPALIGATVFCALLPDVDHVSSTIGKLFYPLASYLQTRFGHRTITHSVFFFLIAVVIFYTLPNNYKICCCYSLGSHLLFDMCTRQGVPLLYPFSRRPWVLPANPAMRLSSTDHRGELVVLAMFLLVGSFCQPLMANGFWTSYNQSFNTWEHVERESRRTRRLLSVRFNDAQHRQHTGLFYRQVGTQLVILTKAGFKVAKPAEVELVSFTTTSTTATEKQITLGHVSADSLNHLLTNYCLSAQIQSAGDLTYFEGSLMKSAKFISVTYTKNFLVSTPPHDDTEIINRIELLTIDRQAQYSQYQRELQAYNARLQRVRMLEMLLQRLAGEYGQSSDYRKGEIIAQRKEAETRLATLQNSDTLPPLAPDLRRFDIQRALLEKMLVHTDDLAANLLIVTTSQPVP